MSSNNSALAHLTATYTDSENEEEVNDNDEGDKDVEMADSLKQKQPTSSVPSPQSAESNQEHPSSKKALRLVSYHDDTYVSDEDDNAPPPSNAIVIKPKEEPAETINDVKDEDIHSKYTHYGFTLPSEPKGKPSLELIKKIQHLYNKMETSNMDMNRVIQERKEFRNPSIYEKLIQFCDINEFGTNYPIEMYDPFQWGPESYYEELAKVQKNEMLKRQKERKENDKIEQAAAAARKVEEEAKKRKSKWDQPAPSVVVKPTITALTASVTGTKGTVISAFGSLPKKIG
ncbi:SAP30-binding protein [Condylostylus longicornis]|uniref:SAP30-binding protein n=1 Tax=Condylostylus longicornis TaxID=2530218 RepID=UPI00244E2BED|nr:SAP30-binding protein [Condylostylus longicornis]